MFVRHSLIALVAVVTAVAAFAGAAHAQRTSAPPEFVALDEVDPTILHDIRYHEQHNFVGRRIHDYYDPICVLTRPAAEALAEAQRALRPQGYTLKVYDCYRPQTAVDDFVGWARRLHDDRMKAEFYPRVDKSRLFADGYIAERSGHSRGSTVDLTLVRLPAAAQPRWRPSMGLVDCAAPYAERFPDNTIDMGTGFDCFDTLSHTLDRRIQGHARENTAAAQAHPGGRRIPQLRTGVVALHAPRRTFPGHVLRLPSLPPRAGLTAPHKHDFARTGRLGPKSRRSGANRSRPWSLAGPSTSCAWLALSRARREITIPGLLAATRTGLTPAGDDELMLDHLLTQ